LTLPVIIDPKQFSWKHLPSLSSILFLLTFSLPHPQTESLITEYPEMTNEYVPAMPSLFPRNKTIKINAILQYKLCIAIKI